MNLKYIFVVILILICFALAYCEQRYSITSLENTQDNILKVNENFKYMDDNKQDKMFKVFSETPTSDTLGLNEIGIYSDYLYININNDMWYVRLSSG